MHEEWTDKLSDYLDGELAADERRAVDVHLRSCAACAAVLEDLKRVVARAQGIANSPRPPAVDLWSGVASRIDAPARVVPLSRTPDAVARAERRISFTLPQLAAAAALVAAVSGGLVWSMRPARDGAAPPLVAQTTAPMVADTPVAADTSAGPTERVVAVSMADAQYDAAVADLERAVKQGRGRLDASTIAIVEHNLQIIDQAIDQAREALAADPVNAYLSGHLVEARRRKLDLLRRAAALTVESN